MTENKTPTRLLFVRHGQDLDNSRGLINGRRDTPLSEVGRTQAVRVAEQLRPEGINCVYSSPLQRATQTASIIAERLGVAEIDVESDLIERDYGVLTGRSPDDIPELANKIIVLNDFRYVIDSPGVESYTDLWSRAGNALRKIQSRQGDKGILIVAHNEVLKMMRANFHGKPWEDELRRPPLNNCEVIKLVS
jgi:broad specificity phosphatase PhoE